MQVLYIFGNNKTSKTNRIVDIAEELQKKGEKTVVIVPEQSTLSTEKVLIDRLQSILSVQVYSFMRLSNKVFQDVGIRNIVNLEETGKLMLLKSIVIRNEKSFKYYKKSALRQGFITELSETISDLYKNNITMTEIDEIISNEEVSEVIRLKFFDIKIILTEYEEFLKNQYICADETLNILANRIEESDYLKDINIIVDGFFGLTEQEYNVFRNLVHIAKSVTITFNVDIKTPTNYFNSLNKFDPYFESKRMVNKITDILKELGNEEFKMEIVSDFGQTSEALSHLKTNFLKFRNFDKFEKDVNDIELFVSKNKVEEIKNIAVKINELTTKGISYNDIKIVCGDLGEYRTIISGIFEQYNIPYFIDIKDDITSNALISVIMSVFNVFCSKYYFENVMNLLKIDLFNNGVFSENEIEIFENYLIEYGIKGYYFEKEFLYGKNNKRYNLEEINSTREKFVRHIESFSEGLSQQKKYEVSFLANKLMEFLEFNNITEKIEEIIVTSEENGELKRKREFEQIWDKLINLIEKMVDILGKAEVTVKEFSEILAGGFEAESIALIPLSQDEVVIGDYQRSKFTKSEVVFVVGAKDDTFPVRPKESSVITDNEKDLLKKVNDKIVTVSDLFLKQNLLIYDILVMAKSKLILSYPYYTLKGDTNTPAQLIKKVSDIFPNIVEKQKIDLYPTNKNALFSYVVKLKQKEHSDTPLTEKELEIIEFYKNDDDFKFKMEIVDKVIAGYKPNEMLSKNAINELYNHKMITSISKLERYAKCPFSFFLEYNLKIRDRKYFEVRYADIGTVFHYILDRFIVYTKKNNIDYRVLSEEDVSDIVEEIVSSVENSEFLFIFKNSNRYSYYLERMKQIAKSSINALIYHQKCGEYEVMASEFEFGANDISKIVVKIDDENEIILTGKVDRVDIYTDGEKKYVKILDFKTGSKTLSEQDIEKGVQLQLLTYLDIILKKGNEIFSKNQHFEYLAGGVYYFEIKDAVLSEDSYKDKIIKNRLNGKEIKELLLKEFMLDGLTYEDIDVIKKIDNKLLSEEKGELINKSDIVKVEVTKKGEISKRSKTIDLEKFEDLRQSVNENIIRLSRDIFDGKIGIDYKSAEEFKACSYCDYSAICKRDTIH